MPIPGSLDDQYLQALRDIAVAVRENTQAITEYTELFKQTIQEPPANPQPIKPPSPEPPAKPKFHLQPCPEDPRDDLEDDDFAIPPGPKVRI